MSPFIYPIEVEDFQKFFLKLEVYDQALPQNSNSRPSLKLDNIIYLPLPKGLLREDLQLDYSKRELGVLGENVIQKYDSVKNALANVVSGAKSISEVTTGLGTSIAEMGADSLNTWLEQQVMKTENIFFKIGTQAAGYTRAPNFTLLFDGISRVREFVLEWKLTPKNEEDAKALEKIIKQLQKATLPELSDVNYLEEAYEALIPTVVKEFFETPEDQQETKDVARANEPIADKLFSSTFILPKQFKISIMEKIGDNFNQINYLMDFPHYFSIRDISAYYGVNSETETFIKGDDGYYHQSYEITVIMMENKLYTADNVGSN